MSRISDDKTKVEQMIRLYCRKKEGNGELCAGCEELLRYATSRLERCRFGNDKPTCRRCPIHCYKPQMRQQIQAVMRWAGPRMMLYHPMAALRHLMGI